MISSLFFTGITPRGALEGAISSFSSTEFFADGTYKGEGFGGSFANFTGGSGLTSGGENATAGSFGVQNGLVISTPSNGRPSTAA